MELLQLRYFKDAAELENFSAVAEKNMVPQPSISKTIKKLEAELGVSLFDRNGKHITLNGNGKFFYEKVSAALGELNEGIDHFKNINTNIVLYPQAGARFISLLIADFLTTKEKIYLSTVNYSSDLNNNYDFTFMQTNVDMSGFEYINLMDDEIICIASDSHPLASKKIISLEDIKDENYIAHYSSMNLRVFTDAFCREQGGFTPRVVYETNDYLALRYLISQNRGIGLMPKTFFELQPAKNIVSLELKEKAYRSLALAWDKNKKLNNAEKEFVQFCKEWFAAL